MSIFLVVLAIVVSLVLVVGIHEFGHMVAARQFGVIVERFSIGFGRPIMTWHSPKTGVEWVWALWPLGGYVKLLDSRTSNVSAKQLKHCFDKQAAWKRLVILVSGVFSNLVLAWLAFVLIFVLGYKVIPPKISSVTPNTHAAQAGLQAGDQLVHVAGRDTPTWRGVAMQLIMHWGDKQVPVTVHRASGDKQTLTLDLTDLDLKLSPYLLHAIGFGAALHEQPKRVYALPLHKAMGHAFARMHYYLTFFWVVLKHLLTGVLPFSILLGPLGMFSEMVWSFKRGVVAFSSFIGSFSLAVAWVNILPIPGLDGAAILYVLIEKIKGSPMTMRLEVLLYQLAFILMCVLLIQLVMNDIQRYLPLLLRSS